MLRSLFTAISGLDAHQQMLDVISNNIANVNTVGYKATSAQFEDTLSQTLTGEEGPTGASGGIDGTQVGLGVRLASTGMSMEQGAPEATGNPYNMMISGDGYFMVQKDGQQLYTRAGDFSLDSNGHLVTPDGALVQGSDGNVLDLSGLTNGTYQSFSIGQDGTISATKADGTIDTLGQVGLATFPNPQGLTRTGDNDFAATSASGNAEVGAPGTGSRGSVTSGYVEMSNVDLSQELTGLIIAERGFQANSKVITTSDEVLQTLVNLKN